MKYCRNCGAQLKDGDMFCAGCGMTQYTRNQNNGANNGAPSSDANIQYVNLARFNSYLKEAKGMYLSVTLRPVTAIKNTLLNLKIQSSIVLLIFLSAVCGLLNMWHFNQAFSPVLFPEAYSIQNGSVFLCMFVFVVIAATFLGFIIFIITKLIFRAEADFKAAFGLSVASSVPLVNFLFLSIVLNYITRVLGTLSLLSGLTIMIICIYLSVRELIRFNEDATLTAVILCFSVFTILLYFSTKFILSREITDILSLFPYLRYLVLWG